MTILTFSLVFMIAFTVLAVQVILWQNQDISVDIVSENETGNQEVSISIRNTAGSTLLFYENTEMTGKIEYLSENGWVEYCDVSYTSGNAKAISQLYGGTFAELEPGEDWNLSVPADKVADMKNGTYRIKMTYITEKNYNKYLETSYKNRNNSESNVSKNDESKVVSQDESTDFSTDISDEITDGEDLVIKDNNVFGELSAEVEDSEEIIDNTSEDKEEFLAASQSEVFIKTFDIEIPEDFVSAISIEGRSIDNDDISFVAQSEEE